ncbi:hypothetical protein [Metabacillus herbersteinensis]
MEKNADLTNLLKDMKSKKLGIKRVKVKEETNDIVLSCIVTATILPIPARFLPFRDAVRLYSAPRKYNL